MSSAQAYALTSSRGRPVLLESSATPTTVSYWKPAPHSIASESHDPSAHSTVLIFYNDCAPVCDALPNPRPMDVGGSTAFTLSAETEESEVPDVFSPPYPYKTIFKCEITINPSDLPPLIPHIVIEDFIFEEDDD